MARVFAIGIATLDIINTVDGFPAEDAEVRAVSQRLARGGNATNTLAVLSQFGHRVSWGGVAVDEPDFAHIREDLARYEIGTTACRLLDAGKVPTSYITLNEHTGSRTIVHYRNLPEFSFDDFCRIDLENVDWLHFEGRNVEETAQMLALAHNHAPALRCSVEVEKPRESIEVLFADADVLLFSPDYARARGTSPEALLAGLRATTTADLFCTAGAAGAMAMDKKGELHRSRAFPPSQVVDTLGAGDTFNAAVIDGYLRGLGIDSVLSRACRVAGAKVGQPGFADLHPLMILDEL